MALVLTILPVPRGDAERREQVLGREHVGVRPGGLQKHHREQVRVAADVLKLCTGLRLNVSYDDVGERILVRRRERLGLARRPIQTHRHRQQVLEAKSVPTLFGIRPAIGKEVQERHVDHLRRHALMPVHDLVGLAGQTASGTRR